MITWTSTDFVMNTTVFKTMYIMPHNIAYKVTFSKDIRIVLNQGQQKNIPVLAGERFCSSNSKSLRGVWKPRLELHVPIKNPQKSAKNSQKRIHIGIGIITYLD